MKQEILKVVNKIKDNLKAIDNDGFSHPILDDIYENLSLIEDAIYDDDINSDSISFEDEDY
jgi:hypothetical protein